VSWAGTFGLTAGPLRAGQPMNTADASSKPPERTSRRGAIFETPLSQRNDSPEKNDKRQ
jgi:hypothetical protein